MYEIVDEMLIYITNKIRNILKSFDNKNEGIACNF